MVSCNCGSAPNHKVWCDVSAARRKRRAAEQAGIEKRPTAAQKRQAEHRDLVARHESAKRLYDAGVRGMAGEEP